jgi:polysaccharide biosynthesis transport protein
MKPAENNNFDLKFYLKVFFRRKWFFIIPFFGISIFTSISTFFLTEKYQASSIILAEKGKIINPLMQGVGIATDDQERLKNLKQKVLNKPQLEAIAKKLKLVENPQNAFEMEACIQELMKIIELNTKGSDYFEILCTGKDPQIITSIVQVLVDNFLKQNIIDSEKDTNAAVNFMRSQLDVYEKKLEKSEQALKEFKQKYIDEMPGTENTALHDLTSYKSQLSETQLKLKELQMEISSLENQLSKEKEIVLKEQTVEKDPLMQKLRDMKTNYSELLSRYTEDHPEIIAMKKQIEEIEKQIKNRSLKDNSIVESETTSVNPTYRTLYERLNSAKIDYQTLMTREHQLSEKVKTNEEKVKNIPAREEELARLTRDYTQNEEMYTTFLKKLEEARVSGQLAEENKGEKFSVVEPVKKPIKPISPNKLKIMLIGFIFSITIGLGMVFLKNFLDDTINDYHEAEKFFKKGMVLGTISNIKSTEGILKQNQIDKLTLITCTLLIFVQFLLGFLGAIDFKLFK